MRMGAAVLFCITHEICANTSRCATGPRMTDAFLH